MLFVLKVMRERIKRALTAPCPQGGAVVYGNVGNKIVPLVPVYDREGYVTDWVPSKTALSETATTPTVTAPPQEPQVLTFDPSSVSGL